MAETENNETETPGATEAAAPRAEPAEVVPPKERRRRARAAKAAQTKTRQSLTPEERHAERVAERQRKAKARRVERGRSREKARASGASTAQATPPREHGPGRQKTRQGVVVSDKADKTITVRIDVVRRHRRYEKIVRTSSTLHVHDESNDAHTGDTVIVRESRPMSRLKRWRLIQVVERAE
ncbi:MAG: 30S ribosomal protein S17 [Solirubrobacterales bacterium]|nr:30S ribosomal protein S17 [Solirubrobacterales bacterium]